MNTTTDVHSHLLGVLPPEKLIAIGLKHNIEIPVSQLKSMGIDIDNSDDDSKIPLEEVLKGNYDRYCQCLNYNHSEDCQEDTCNVLTRSYWYRSTFFAEETIKDILWESALYYKSMGVNYVELSTKWFYRSGLFDLISAEIPPIEEKTGVKLRFLASIDREYPEAKLRTYIDYAISSMDNPYIVGCDILGNENQDVEHICIVIKDIVGQVLLKDLSYTIRIHSGEKPETHENTKKILKYIKSIKENMENQYSQQFNFPPIRLGHALYGIDNECLSLIKEMGVIIEINITSNLRLKNVNNITDIPLKKYIDAGIPVVLGTDSPGILGTTTIKELAMAKSLGVNEEDILKIQATEDKIKSK